VKGISLLCLERRRAVNPAALRDLDLANATVAKDYAVAILRDDPKAAAEFGTDAAAVARLAAILRHDFGGAPIGSPSPSA
jgi:hypothetical protein